MLWLKLYDHPVLNDIRTNDNILKFTTCQENDYTTGCLLDYPISKNTIRW